MAHSFIIKTGASSSPFGDIKTALRKVAEDPNDPNREAARAALRALGDDDEREASDDTEDATRPKGVPAAARAKALSREASEVTRLSPYAAMLDEEMGLTTGKGVRVEGSQLILSSAGHRVRP